MSNELIVLENIIGLMQATHPETALEKCTLGFLEELYRIKLKESSSEGDDGWIPVGRALPPEDAVNPVTGDGYIYPVSVDFYGTRDVRYYVFWKGHWYNNSPHEMDKYVTAWMPRPEPYKGQENSDQKNFDS